MNEAHQNGYDPYREYATENQSENVAEEPRSLSGEQHVQTTDEQIEPEQAERLIGDVSIEQWIRGGFQDWESLPQIRDVDDLKRVLELKALERDSLSVYRNWMKSFNPEDYPEDEFFALMEHFANNWLLRSTDLKAKASGEWGEKFGNIIEILAYQMELPQQWLDASAHAGFMCGYQPESLIIQLRESLKTEEEIRDAVKSALYEESRKSGQPVDEEEYDRRVATQVSKNNILWANAAKLAEESNLEFDGDVNAQMQANRQRRSARRRH